MVTILVALLINVQDGWQPLSVPGAWEDIAKDRLANYDGFAWFRCWVKVPADWKGSDLALAVEKVQNVHEAYWNGTRVGGVGSFPPGFRDATATANSYTIPEKLIQAGAYNLVAVRVYNGKAKGGFLGTAPSVVHETRAIALQGTWQFRTGDSLDWAKPTADKPKEDAVFSRVVETTSLPPLPWLSRRDSAPPRPPRLSPSPPICASTRCSPSRSCVSPCRSTSTSVAGCGWCSICSIPIRRASSV
jgi:hypothetical protein